MKMRFVVGTKKWLLALTAATAGAIAVAAPLSEQEKLLVGTWYGEFQPSVEKPIQRFLMTRKEDGSFELHARLYERGKSSGEMRNKGLWGVSNGMYFTLTTEAAGKPTDLRMAEVSNPYVVRSLSGDTFVYQHIPSGNQFRVVRVDPSSAKLPD